MGHLGDFQFVESDPGVDVRGDSRFRDESRELAELDGRAQASKSAIRASEIFAQEVSPGAEDLVTGDVSPDDAGHLVVEIEAEDEADVPAGMAEQGRNDADQEMRRANHANTI